MNDLAVEQFRKDLRAFIIDMDATCRWCAKNAVRRADGCHIYKTVVVGPCTLGWVGEVLDSAKELHRVVSRPNTKRDAERA